MYRYSDDFEPPRSRLSLRVTILGGIAVALFSIVFFRLWYLQVLSGDRYLEAANDNRVREIREQGPRGEILDRDGNVLVGNRLGMALQVEPDEMAKGRLARAEEIRRLGEIAGLEPSEIRTTIREIRKESPDSPVILRRDLDPDQIFYLREHQLSFPGVTIEQLFTRTYPNETLGAHLFGSTGEVTKEQLTEPRYSDLEQGDVVGQSGLEYEYDRFLRGQAGTARVQVDALGRPKGQLRVDPATPGNNLRTTIDPSVQETGEAALGTWGQPGAFVAMDVHTGEIIAMGSQPTFDPRIFTKSVTARQYKALTAERNGAPLENRAIRGAYPTGSVFKLITAIAALEGSQGGSDEVGAPGGPLITPTSTIFDDGVLKLDVIEFRNAHDAVYGPLSMATALKVSSDVFFYELGVDAPAKGDGGLIQDWARDLGLASRTGIDLPDEAEGLIPTPAWRNRLYEKEQTDRPWTLGDNVNLAVGQGDLQADPLQMALAYATLANGGTVVRPHIGERVEDVSGRVLHEVNPDPTRQIEIGDSTRQVILDGMRMAAMEPGGTSYKVFGNFSIQIAGKTGTAERAPHGDQAWYVALAPYENPRIVVAVTVEEGGFGVDTAAPVALQMLSDYLDVTPSAPAADIPVPGTGLTGE